MNNTFCNHEKEMYQLLTNTQTDRVSDLLSNYKILRLQ